MRFSIHSPVFLSVLLLLCTGALLLVAGCTSTPAPSSTTTIPSTVATTASSIPTTIETTAVPPSVAVPETTPEAVPTTTFKTYSNSTYGFSIDYPGDWGVNEVNRQEPEISRTRYEVVEFYSPSFLRCNTEKTECVNVRAEMKIEADSHPSSTDLDTFFVKEVARVTTTNSIEITKRDAMFKLDGDKAYRLDYVSDTDKEDISALSAYTVRNGVGYIITYHAHAPERSEQTNQFEQYYNDAMAMFGSFTTTAGNYKTI